MTNDHRQKAQLFRDLNERGQLLLPNAWDAASARIFEKAGFPAIGTTSAGIAYTLGVRDGEQIDRATAIQQTGIIAKAVSIPITADIESGYGTQVADVVETVNAALDAGAVGVNLEDSTHNNAAGSLLDINLQAKRIAAARHEADKRKIVLTINARTDTFILGLGAGDDERVSLTIERGKEYLAAGADLIFVPLVVEPRIVKRLADSFDGRLSVMAMPGAPSATELFKAGARRVSVGQTAMLATLGLVSTIANELKSSGTWSSIENTFFGFSEGEALFP